MRVIRDHAFLEESTKLFVELFVSRRVGIGLLVEEFDEPPGQHFVELLFHGRVLHRLARDIQREILTVDHPLQKPQPFGQKSLGFRFNKDLATI